MDTPEIVVKQAASGVGWRTAAIVILVAAGLAVGVRECEHKADLAKKQTAIDSTGKVADRERTKRMEADLRTADIQLQRAKEQGKYLQSLALVEAEKKRIADWAKSLSTKRQIGEIAKVLPQPLQADSSRLQASYSPADSALIAELYTRIQERELLSGKLDTAGRLIASLTVDNERLKRNNAAYQRGYVLIWQKLLKVHKDRNALNINLGKQVLRVAEQVGRMVTNPEKETSELEIELNSNARHR